MTDMETNAMNSTPVQRLFGPYTGCVAAEFDEPVFVAWMETVRAAMDAEGRVDLTRGRNRNVRVQAPWRAGTADLVIKSFGRESWLGDCLRLRKGSKAMRTWRAAEYLHAHGVGAPVPVACLERREGLRLREGYFISRYADGCVSFKDELVRLLRHDSHCCKFMLLMETVARAVRAMHDAGLIHHDLGNQNILLRRVGDAEWADVMFIDLNRSRIRPSPSDELRARDISRIYLPSDLLRVFHEMYFAPSVVPKGFHTAEARCRSAFFLHGATRVWRHPLRERRIRRSERMDQRYPSEKDMWIWDDRSAQAVSALRPKDRSRHYGAGRNISIACVTAARALPVWRRYRQLLGECYPPGIEMSARVGVSLESGIDMDRQLALLEPLKHAPVFMRFYHHETAVEWSRTIEQVRRLKRMGRSVSIALVQDRAAVLQPERWSEFLGFVVGSIGAEVEFVEVCHAINRVKWGIWNLKEYRGLMDAVAVVAQDHPEVRFTGPAVIDFEYPFALAALASLPPGLRLSALSHHLYVDRRGGPEGRQNGFSALEKFALARSMAAVSPECEARLIVSEVNWPIVGTDVYSPVNSPYMSPGQRFNDPSVSEDDYADYMIRYVLMAVCSGMVDQVFWWRLVARGFGLVDDTVGHQWRPRPAYEMLRTLLGWLDGAIFSGRGRQAGAEIYRFTGKDGRAFELAYAPEGIVEIPLSTSAVQVFDAFGREIRSAGGTLRLGPRPVCVVM